MTQNDYQQPGEPKPEAERSEFVNEMQQLGQQIEATFKAFMAGPGQQIRREVGEAFQELGAQVQRTVKSVQDRPDTENLGQTAKKAAQKIGEQPIVQEIEDVLVSGIQAINAKLKQLNERLKTDAPGTDGSASSAGMPTQRLEIVDESDTRDDII